MTSNTRNPRRARFTSLLLAAAAAAIPLAAVVQAGTGSQFTAFNSSTMSDLKSTVDQWADNAGSRLDELRKTGK